MDTSLEEPQVTLKDCIEQLRIENKKLLDTIDSLRDVLELILKSHELTGPCAAMAFEALNKLEESK